MARERTTREMEPFNSAGSSWADQWDYNNPDPLPAKASAATNKKAKDSKASSALKKMKDRIKELYQKKSGK